MLVRRHQAPSLQRPRSLLRISLVKLTVPIGKPLFCGRLSSQTKCESGSFGELAALLLSVSPDGAGTRPLIAGVAGLTAEIRSRLGSSVTYKMTLDTVVKRRADGSAGEPNIEVILSHVRALRDVIRGATLDGLSQVSLGELETEIYDLTNKIVDVRLPSSDTPHHRVAAWIRAIKRAHPVEIFTSNYDLLMEQALEESRVPYFDGFAGSDRPFFDIGSIEQDTLPARWARIWKVHGSINWWQSVTGRVERRSVPADASARRVIYPTHLTYEESRRMPYLAMLDRLRAFLSHGQAVLATCGYWKSWHLGGWAGRSGASNGRRACGARPPAATSRRPGAGCDRRGGGVIRDQIRP